MNRSSKGRRYEYKTRDILEEQGYTVTRSAASKGVADLVAFSKREFKLVQVKSGKSIFSKEEEERFLKVEVPDNCVKELWKWYDYCKEPKIRRLYCIGVKRRY